MRRLALRTLCALVPLRALCAFIPWTASAQYDHQPAKALATVRVSAPALRHDLGRHHHRISTDSARTQELFDQGMRWLWAANGVEAAVSFAAAEASEPQCAMCAWGIAAALGIPSTDPPRPDVRAAAREAIRRAQERRAFATAVEVALIEAQAVRHTADPRSSDSLYAEEMRRVKRAFPEHEEVRVLYADALMALSRGLTSITGTPDAHAHEIALELEDVLAINADHPGACHLYVHLMEARDPARALPCAEQLATTMPASGHLLQLPMQLYVRMGRYPDAITAGERLFRRRSAARGTRSLIADPRDAELLAFAATMSGASRAALRYAGAAKPHSSPLVALTLAAFGRWGDVLESPIPTAAPRVSLGMAWFARGAAFAAKRRWAEAQVILDSVRELAVGEPREPRLAIAAEALAGELEFRRGRRLSAIEHFTAAVALEDKLAHATVAAWHVPLRHALGRVLLVAGRARDAERVYREDLARYPENGWSLHGLSESLLAQGRRGEAREVAARFARAWAGADVQLRGSRM